LDHEKCKGCTNCIKRCPTEAIRVRDGKAQIIQERCIDCGECIRVCPNHAKVAVTDSFDAVNGFPYVIAIPAPSLYGQFKHGVTPGHIVSALAMVGFNEVFEAATAAEAVTVAIREFLKIRSRKKPLISSACPAVLRLLQVRFPGLLDHVIPIESPMETAARMAKEKVARDHGLSREEIGAFFITPCPAKVTAVKQPIGRASSFVDGVISMQAVYSRLINLLNPSGPLSDWHGASAYGIGWGRAGGENVAIGMGELLAVDGIHSVISVLEEVEKGKLSDVDYLECQACPGGCIGGPLTVENPFIARVRIRNLADRLGGSGLSVDEEQVRRLCATGYFDLTERIGPRPVMKLDNDVSRAIVKLGELERTVAALPGLDCGSCGSPSCRALAEDIVRGLAYETDCIFKLRERVMALAAEMVELSRKVPPAMGAADTNKKGETA